MRVRRTDRVVAGLLFVGLLAWVLPAQAREPTPSGGTTATRWWVGGGGDDFRTSFSPTEKQPPWIGCRPESGPSCSDDKGPFLEWVTKISDLPSGVFLDSALVAWDGILYVAGGATNSFLALDMKTGLPIWRFTPDPRTDGYSSSYPSSNAPIIHDGVVYMSFSNGFVYALDGKTGRKIWSYQVTDGFADTSSWTDQNPSSDSANSPYHKESYLRNQGDFAPVHGGVVYPKIHGITAFCGGKVVVMALSGWVYGIDAKTGKLSWKKQGDSEHFPGELVWPEFKTGGVQKGAESGVGNNHVGVGMSTRRFEAVPGAACGNGEVQAAGSDGHVRFIDPANGKDRAGGGDVGPEFDRTDPNADGGAGSSAQDFCVNAGFNCDIAVGLEDPDSKDYIVTTLDGRIIRLDWKTHAPEWRRHYSAPLPFETSGSLPPGLTHLEHGFIAEAVVGGPMAFDHTSRYLFAGNQDGHIYVLYIPRESVDDTNQTGSDAPCPSSIQNRRRETVNSGEEKKVPCLVQRFGLTRNPDLDTPYTRKGVGGPWDYNQLAIGGLVLGGDVLYAATWDNQIRGIDVRDPVNPRTAWQFKINWNDTFRYPPFGQTYKTPHADLDDKIMSAPALLGGHLYFAAHDGSVYSFNLFHRTKPVRNLVILGSGAVPFLPEFKEKLGQFDRIWTPADWYKNQVAPAGYRFPKAAGLWTASGALIAGAVAWWWIRRREDILEEIEEGAR